MLYPNPYFYYRIPKEPDLVRIAVWMSAGKLAGLHEVKILRQLKRQYRDKGGAMGKKSWIAVRAGEPVFLLELTVTGEAYLTGRKIFHSNPWRALEAWGYSIPWLFSQQGLSELWIPLPDSRVAEIRALQRLGCRRKEKEGETNEELGVWVSTAGEF